MWSNDVDNFSIFKLQAPLKDLCLIDKSDSELKVYCFNTFQKGNQVYRIRCIQIHFCWNSIILFVKCLIFVYLTRMVSKLNLSRLSE